MYIMVYLSVPFICGIVRYHVELLKDSSMILVEELFLKYKYKRSRRKSYYSTQINRHGPFFTAIVIVRSARVYLQSCDVNEKRNNLLGGYIHACYYVGQCVCTCVCDCGRDAMLCG